MAKSNKRPTAVFEEPDKIGDFMIDLGGIYENIDNNTPAIFPVMSTPVATMIANLGALASAESTAQTRAPGSAGARDIKYNVCLKDKNLALATVQQVMDNAPDVITAEAACHASGFELRVNGVRVLAPISAKQDKTPASIALKAKSGGRNVAYEWGMNSIDAGANWTYIPTTVVAKTIVPDLASVRTIFRVRIITSGGISAWFVSNSIIPQ